jgi:hypothetical protein
MKSSNEKELFMTIIRRQKRNMMMMFGNERERHGNKSVCAFILTAALVSSCLKILSEL